jgi:Tol biopolymer transport system component
MPGFDTRKPQEPNEPNTPRISLVANRLSVLLSAGKIRTRSMASTLRRSLIANKLASLLAGGILLFVIATASVWLLGSSFGVPDRSQQESEHAKPGPSGGSEPPQQEAELANLKPLDVCADSGGGHRREASDADPNGEKILFASGSQVVMTSAGTFESSSLGNGSIQLYAMNADGTGLTPLTRSAATKLGVPNRGPDDREVTIAWSVGTKIGRIGYDAPGRSTAQNYASAIVCSPDGEKAAFVSEGSDSASATSNFTDDIKVVTSAGTTRLGKAGPNGDENYPHFSPDSDKLAFMRDGDVYVANSDGSDQEKLHDGTPSDGIATWLPDSEKIVFTSDDSVSVIGVDGTGLTQLADNVSYPTGVVLSPGAEKVAFVSSPPGSYDSTDLYVANTDGTGLTRLTRNASGYKVIDPGGPFFSPDGKQIAFVLMAPPSGPSLETDVYVVRVDGTGLTRLTNTKAWEGIVAWVGI